MTCKAARRLIPLFSGGDLKAPKTSAVVGHVAACAACRAEVEEFTAVRSLLPLSSLSFDESERATLRRRVLDEIARRESPSPAPSFLLGPRYALAALVGAFVLAASLVSPFFVRDAERALVAPNFDRPAHVATPIPAEAHVAAAAPLEPERRRRASKSSRPPPPPSKNLHSAVRFEIQTGNANVRIIWFAGGNPAGETSAGSTGDPNGVS